MDNHFDKIANRYDKEIPDHIRIHLLNKKVSYITNSLLSHGSENYKGLDCGCGTGHYLKRLAENGLDMAGFEWSDGMLKQALENNNGQNVKLVKGNILEIPFKDQSFDFAYTINVLHHLQDFESQVAAVKEMIRVVKPGGLIILQDFDADNPLVRFYMNYLFPLTSSIDDDDTEIWVSPKKFGNRGFEGVKMVDVSKFTIIPNFVPKPIFKVLQPIERVVELLSRNSFGAHFALILQRL